MSDVPGVHESSRRRWLPVALGAAAVAGLIVAFVMLPLAEWIEVFVTWLRGLGAVGVVAFAAAYVLATALALPGSLLTLGAGFVYGPVWGLVLVSPVSVLAATVAFALGRTLLRRRVSRALEHRPRLRAIDDAVDQQGATLVLLLRLSPVIPFNLLNYALSLTKIRARSYIWASFVGMLPGTFLYVYLGSTLTAFGQVASGAAADAGPWSQILFWGGLVATAAVTVVMTRIARRALRKTLPAAVADD